MVVWGKAYMLTSHAPLRIETGKVYDVKTARR